MVSDVRTDLIRRLERRGGEIWVFRLGYGPRARYRYRGREGGAAIVTGPDDFHEEYRWVLRTDFDRASLAAAMEATVRRLAADERDVATMYELRHRDLLDTDGGYGEVGCLVLVLSAIGAGVMSAVGSFVLEAGHPLGVGMIVFVFGFFGGMYGTEVVIEPALRVPRLRDAIDTVAFVWWLIGPLIVGLAGLVALIGLLGVADAVRP